MKKLLTMAALATTMLAASIITAQAAEPIRVTVDGVTIQFQDTQPQLVDGRTLVPVRGVFEAMGFDVEWDGDNQAAILTSPTHRVTVLIGLDYMQVVAGDQRSSVRLDVPAQIVEGRTMLPLRAVSESTGAEVEWRDNTAIITMPRVNDHVVDRVPEEYPLGVEESNVVIQQPEPGVEFEHVTEDGRTIRLWWDRNGKLVQMLGTGSVHAVIIPTHSRIYEQVTGIRHEPEVPDDYRHLPFNNLLALGYTMEEARTIFENYMIIYLNEYRAAMGLTELTIDERLRSAARSHTDCMAYFNYLGHKGRDGSTPRERARRYGFNGTMTEVAGVHSGAGATPACAIQNWLESTRGHRREVLHPYCTAAGPGVSLAFSERGTIVRVSSVIKLAH